MTPNEIVIGVSEKDGLRMYTSLGRVFVQKHKVMFRCPHCEERQELKKQEIQTSQRNCCKCKQRIRAIELYSRYEPHWVEEPGVRDLLQQAPEEGAGL